MEFPDLCRWIPEHVKEHGYTNTSMIRVEPKASGKSTVQQMKQTTSLNIIEDKAPDKDKVTRVKICSPKIEAGKVLLVEGYWNESFLAQISGFPKASHDDEVDCLTAIVERELIKQLKFGSYDFGGDD